MTNKALIQLLGGLQTVKNIEGASFPFSYAIAKNIRVITPLIETLRSTIKPSEKYQEYDEKRVELARNHAKKDENGKPVEMVIGQGSQFIIEDQKSFEADLKKLQNDPAYKKEIESFDRRASEFNKALDGESEKVELHMIEQSDVPEKITPGQLEGIFDIIK